MAKRRKRCPKPKNNPRKCKRAIAVCRVNSRGGIIKNSCTKVRRGKGGGKRKAPTLAPSATTYAPGPSATLPASAFGGMPRRRLF